MAAAILRPKRRITGPPRSGRAGARRAAVIATSSTTETTAIAAPWPKLLRLKARVNVQMPRVVVPPSGPPWVRIQIWLNTVKSQITDRMVTRPRIGRRNGKVIVRWTRHGRAPSSAAAS